MLHLPTLLTADEVEFGFCLRSAPTGGYAAIAELRGGLFAVKSRSPSGEIEYRICNRSFLDLYATASTLTELRERFATRRASGDASG